VAAGSVHQAATEQALDAPEAGDAPETEREAELEAESKDVAKTEQSESDKNRLARLLAEKHSAHAATETVD
jgi:hypothetical protein